jgi:hypothetical protein
MNNLNKKILFVLILVFIATLNVNEYRSIGITPGRKTIDFSPNYETSVSFSVINNEKKDMKILLYVDGEMNNSVTLNVNSTGFKSIEESKSFTYNVKLPSKITTPGIHEARIIAKEVPIISGTTIGAAPSVISQLYVMVPYPGKYAKVSLNVKDTQGDKPVKFFVSLENLGLEDISKAQATIDIYDSNNKKVASINTNTLKLKSKDREDLIAEWNLGTNLPGAYYAKASVVYDNEVAETDIVFSVGEVLVDILSIDVNDYKLGGIAKFSIGIENKGAAELNNVYTEVYLNDLNGKEVARFKSASEDVIKSKSKNILSAFWDTKGFKEGTYTGRIKLYFNDQSTEKQLRAVITLNSIKTELIGISAKAVSVDSSGNNNGLLILLVFVIIAVNIGWFVYFKRKNKSIKQ